jgi:hypothetical protein
MSTSSNFHYFARGGFSTIVRNEINTSGGWLFPPTVRRPVKRCDLSCGIAHFIPILRHKIGTVLQVRLYYNLLFEVVILLNLSCYWSTYLSYDSPRRDAWLVIYTT